jgi:uncharacterized membrane protein YjjP (DUF1212 family)
MGPPVSPTPTPNPLAYRADLSGPSSVRPTAIDFAPRSEGSEYIAEAFVLDLGKALHRYGAPAHRLEELMTGVAYRLGLRAQVFSTPTAVFAAFGAPPRQHQALLRVDPGETNLEKQVLLDAIAEAVASGRVSPEQGTTQVEAVVTAPRRYGALVTALSFAATSGAGARFFEGGAREIAASTLVGLAIGLLAVVSGRLRIDRVFDAVAAFVAALLAAFFAWSMGPLSISTTILAGLLVLLPGLTLTTAMTELATKNLSSGTSRLAFAGLTFLQLACGVALGGEVASRFGLAPAGPPTGGLPPWTEGLSLIVAGLALTVLFRARPRDAIWVLAGGFVAYGGARYGTTAFGPELGAGAGALALSVFANLYARLWKRPAAVCQLPGLVLLVPGSLGFRSVISLLEQNVLTGVQTAFRMSLIAVALVAGLLLGNALVSPRRSL